MHVDGYAQIQSDIENQVERYGKGKQVKRSRIRDKNRKKVKEMAEIMIQNKRGRETNIMRQIEV